MPKQRNSPPSIEEAAAGARVKKVRQECEISRRLLAEQIGISADQLNRIERGTVSLRLGVAWDFCELTSTNPLWLAFGDPYPRLVFGTFGLRIPLEDRDVLFLPRMMKHRDGGDILMFSAERSAPTDPRSMKLKTLASNAVKRYLSRMPVTPPDWESLRIRLVKATAALGAKAALAREFNVSKAAVSQWLSGGSAPTADTTLRLLGWVTVEEVSQKENPDRALTRPGRKTQTSESNTTNEQTNSGRKKR